MFEIVVSRFHHRHCLLAGRNQSTLYDDQSVCVCGKRYAISPCHCYSSQAIHKEKIIYSARRSRPTWRKKQLPHKTLTKNPLTAKWCCCYFIWPSDSIPSSLPSTNTTTTSFVVPVLWDGCTVQGTVYSHITEYSMCPATTHKSTNREKNYLIWIWIAKNILYVSARFKISNLARISCKRTDGGTGSVYDILHLIRARQRRVLIVNMPHMYTWVSFPCAFSEYKARAR